MPNWQNRAKRCRRKPIVRWSPSSSTVLSSRRCRVPEGEPAQPRLHRHGKREADMLGRLSWAAIPLDQPLPLYAMGVVGIVILIVLGIVTVKGWWPYLWREWITSVDHKRIGVMYVILGLVMLLRGYSD